MTVDWKMLLEYLKVLLSGPAVAGWVVLILVRLFRPNIAGLLDRIRAVNWPGGSATFGGKQARAEAAEASADGNRELPEVAPVQLPQGVAVTPDQATQIKQLVRSERANAALWEYKYLNLYLVRFTQAVLDWLATLPEPISAGLVDNHLQQYVADVNERTAILGALQKHHLIAAVNGVIRLTDKGREYLQWRGPMRPTTAA